MIKTLFLLILSTSLFAGGGSGIKSIIQDQITLSSLSSNQLRDLETLNLQNSLTLKKSNFTRLKELNYYCKHNSNSISPDIAIVANYSTSKVEITFLDEGITFDFRTTVIEGVFVSANPENGSFAILHPAHSATIGIDYLEMSFYSNNYDCQEL